MTVFFMSLEATAINDKSIQCNCLHTCYVQKADNLL